MVVTELADQLAEDRPLVREVDVEGPCATLALWVTSTIEARSKPLVPNTSSAAFSSRRRVACPRAVTGTAGYPVLPIVLSSPTRRNVQVHLLSSRHVTLPTRRCVAESLCRHVAVQPSHRAVVSLYRLIDLSMR